MPIRCVVRKVVQSIVFCKKHDVWKAYARRILGDELLMQEERDLLPIVTLIGGELNYLWLLLVRHAVYVLSRKTLSRSEKTVYMDPYVTIRTDKAI